MFDRGRWVQPHNSTDEPLVVVVVVVTRMGKRKEEVWDKKKYPLLFVAFVFIRAELLLNARTKRILFFSRVSGKRSFVETTIRSLNARFY